MKLLVSMLGLCLLAQAQTTPAPAPAPAPDPAPVPDKVATIAIQNAIFSTKEGRQAAVEIQTKFGAKKAALEQKRQEVAQLSDRLRQGENAMSEEARESLARSIDQKSKIANREADDDQSEYDDALRGAMQQIGTRLMPVLTKFAKDNGYAMVIDVGSQQAPVVYAAEGVDITGEVVALYDKGAPATPSASAIPPKN